MPGLRMTGDWKTRLKPALATCHAKRRQTTRYCSRRRQMTWRTTTLTILPTRSRPETVHRKERVENYSGFRGRWFKTNVDTSATCNIIPISAYIVLCSQSPNHLIHSLQHMENKTDVCGTTIPEVSYQGTQNDVYRIYVLGENVHALTINQGVWVTARGTTSGQYCIKLSNDAQLVIQSARRVPFKY